MDTNVPVIDRSVTTGVTEATRTARAVDPVHLAAELLVRLREQGSPPGLGYRQAALVDVMRLALAALDVPSTEDSGNPLAETRRAVQRVQVLAGGVR